MLINRIFGFFSDLHFKVIPDDFFRKEAYHKPIAVYMLVQFGKSGVFVDLPSIRPDSIGRRWERKVVEARITSVILVVSSES